MARIDRVYGGRNRFCTCPPMEDFEEKRWSVSCTFEQVEATDEGSRPSGSGELTRLACWRWRPASANFPGLRH